MLDTRREIPVKRYILYMAALLACTTCPAAAQVNGAWSEARVVPVNGRLGPSGKWMVYGGASLLLSRFEVGTSRDTDTSFPVRAGMEFRPNPDLRLLGEVQLAISDAVRDDGSFTLGVLFPF